MLSESMHLHTNTRAQNTFSKTAWPRMPVRPLCPLRRSMHSLPHAAKQCSTLTFSAHCSSLIARRSSTAKLTAKIRHVRDLPCSVAQVLKAGRSVCRFFVRKYTCIGKPVSIETQRCHSTAFSYPICGDSRSTPLPMSSAPSIL